MNKEEIKVGSLVKLRNRFTYLGVVLDNLADTAHRNMVVEVYWSNGERLCIDRHRLEILAEP